MDQMIIDVREPIEFMMGHVKGAVNIPLSKLLTRSSKLEEVPKNASLILYCRSGHRSASAAKFLRSLGYSDITVCVNKEHVMKLFPS